MVAVLIVWSFWVYIYCVNDFALSAVIQSNCWHNVGITNSHLCPNANICLPHNVACIEVQPVNSRYPCFLCPVTWLMAEESCNRLLYTFGEADWFVWILLVRSYETARPSSRSQWFVYACAPRMLGISRNRESSNRGFCNSTCAWQMLGYIVLSLQCLPMVVWLVNRQYNLQVEITFVGWSYA